MSSGPVVAVLMGIPGGRMVDRFGAARVTIVGLVGMGAGSALLAVVPSRLGVPGYVLPLVILTAGYALFQAANNTAVMTNTQGDQRGAVSGMLSLSRNLGLMSGASVMGLVFAHGGMRLTFAVAAGLVLLAGLIAPRAEGDALRKDCGSA